MGGRLRCSILSAIFVGTEERQKDGENNHHCENGKPDQQQDVLPAETAE